jgi:hypothetical protein
MWKTKKLRVGGASIHNNETRESFERIQVIVNRIKISVIPTKKLIFNES